MKIGFIWDVGRFLLHVPLGIIFYGMGLLNPAVAFGSIASFLFYEINEDNHLKDRAYIDIQGSLGGGILAFIIHAVTLLL